MANPHRRGPRALSDVLGELFTVRGYGRLQTSGDLERAWNCAVGEPYCQETRVAELRRGVLSVTVAHSTLLEELAVFRKAEILQALRAGPLGTAITDIRFRIGPIGQGTPKAASEGIEERDPFDMSRRRSTRQHPRRREKKGGHGTDEKAKPGS